MTQPVRTMPRKRTSKMCNDFFMIFQFFCVHFRSLLISSLVWRSSFWVLLSLLWQTRDNSGAALVSEVRVGPLQQDSDLTAETDQEDQVDKEPGQPGNQAGDFQFS